MFCKKCGKEIADGSSFCPFCGKSTGNDKVQDEFNEMVKKEEEKANKVCNFVYTVRAIMLLIGGLMLGYEVAGVIGVIVAVVIIGVILVMLAGKDSDNK